MEGIREQLVKRPHSSEDTVKSIMLMTAAVLVAAVVFSVIYYLSGGMLGAIGLLLAGAALWGGWWLTGMLKVEYEYVIVGAELQIDKIINKRTRKPLCALNMRTAEAFYKSEKHLQNATEVFACGEGSRYSIEFSDREHGKTVIIFTPDERTLEMITPYLPRAI